jgi:hypothetical protein
MKNKDKKIIIDASVFCSDLSREIEELMLRRLKQNKCNPKKAWLLVGRTLNLCCMRHYGLTLNAITRAVEEPTK